MANRTDNFNRANGALSGSTPSGGGGAWAVGGSANWQISSNAVLLSNNVDGVAVIQANAPSVAVQATIVGGAGYKGVLLRGSSDGLNGIFVTAGTDGKSYLGTITAGTASFSNPFGANATGLGWTAGDVMKVEDTGSAVTLFRNGSQVKQWTDNGSNGLATYRIASDYCGVYSNGNGTGSLDDFSTTAITSFSVDRSNVLCGSSGTTVVTLTGSGTSWTGSPFSLSATQTGWTIASQNVISATSATVTLNRGTGTGTITISDGGTTQNVTATNTATAATGNSNTAATWDVKEVPSDGNIIAVPNGVTLTVDASLTIGTSPSDQTTFVVTASGTGSITVADGVTFKVRGNLQVDNGTLQVGTGSTGGAILEMDASQAGTPATTYKLNVGASTKTSSRLKTRGTTGTNAEIRSNASGGNAYITVFDGLCDLQDATITRIGDGTNDCFSLSVNSATTGTHTFTRVTWSACGRFNTTSTVPAAMGLTFDLCRMLSGVNATDLRVICTAPSGAPSRHADQCSFGNAVTRNTAGAFLVTRCMLDNSIGDDTAGAWVAGMLEDNLVRITSLSGTGLIGVAISGDADGNYFLADGGTDNPHIVLPRNTGAQQTLSNAIVEYTSTTITDGGNWFYGGGDWIITNCITIPGVNTDSPGSVTFPSPTCRIRHCTLYSTQGSGGVLIGDGGSSAGVHPEIRDTIFWVRNGETGKAVTEIPTTADNTVTPSGCHYNGLVNLTAPVYGGHYPTTQPGANDVSITTAPGVLPFVDATRNIATWAVVRGSTGSTYADKVADARTFLRNDPTLVAGLIQYIFDGFATTESQFHNTASDGTDRGAAGYTAPGTIRGRPSIMSGGNLSNVGILTGGRL